MQQTNNEEALLILDQGFEIWNTWFRKHYTGRDAARELLMFSTINFNAKNFQKYDFSGVKFSNCTFEFALFHRACFNGAEFEKCNFLCAAFDGALFGERNLLPWEKNRDRDNGRHWKFGQDVRPVIVNECDFSGCNFLRTVFIRAELRKVNFGGATFQGTVLDVELSGVVGLERTVHYGPSSLSILALSTLPSPYPENFLRGCGVTETMITYLPSIFDNAIDYFSCFISYSHSDKLFARRLHDQLQGRGIRCWLDEHKMLPGDDIYEQVDFGLKMYDKVLLCCSGASLTSWWVDNEIDSAFDRERKLMKERGKKILSVIPLNLDNYMFSEKWNSGKKQQVLSRIAADFSGWETDNSKFETQFEKVVKALNSAAHREVPPQSKL